MPAGVNLYNVKYPRNKQASGIAHSTEKEVSQVTEDTVNSNVLKSSKTRKDRCQVLARAAIIPPDLNANGKMSSGLASGISQKCFEDNARQDLDYINIKRSRESNLHRNAEDVSSSVNCGPFNTDKYNDQLKLRDASECGSTCEPLVEKDPLKVWKQMKKNGFMSTFHGGVLVPKPRATKTKAEKIKKKPDTATTTRDQVDRFAKIAAPSGLLNGLNPGIINNVRSSRQVRSKIEALVSSARYEGDTRTLKQSSSAAMALENVSSVSNEESSNQATVSTLSLKGWHFVSYIYIRFLLLSVPKR